VPKTRVVKGGTECKKQSYQSDLSDRKTLRLNQ
jgi:hypothetical protein